MKKIFVSGKNLVSPNDQGADFVELFFDLVFVYAITGITSFTAHNLDASHLLQALLIFWLIWWGWTSYTWSLNAANTRISEVRMMVLVSTGVAFIMASSIDSAFGTEALRFALPYAILRLIGLGLYARVTTSIKVPNARIFAYAIPTIIGLIAVMAGAIADPSFRVWWWLAAIGFDMLAGYLGGRAEGLDLMPSHFAERHGLIVIIALGESLIVAANAVQSQENFQEVIIVGALAVLVTCLLWWSYFAWIKEHLEEHLSTKSGQQQGSLARDAYSILHFPLICGIIGIAVGFEIIMGHPHDTLSLPVAIALSGGYLFFVGFTSFSVWRLSKLVLLPRIIILIISAILLVFTIGQPPYIALSIIAISLTFLILFEWKYSRHT